MVHINDQHITQPAHDGQFGGTICVCPECCKKREEEVEAEELTIFYCVDFISGTCSTPCQTRTNGVMVGSLVCQACENLISIDKNKHIVKCKATPEEPHTCLNCHDEPEWKTRTEFGDCKWNPKKPPHSAVRIEKSSIYKNDPITNCPAWRPK